MRGPIIQALLEDRFKLKLHPETREIPAWALTLAKGDAKLRQFEERGCTTRDLTRPFDPPPPPAPGQTPPCRGLSMAGNAAKQSFTMIAEGASLDMLSGLYPLALMISRWLTRPGSLVCSASTWSLWPTRFHRNASDSRWRGSGNPVRFNWPLDCYGPTGATRAETRKVHGARRIPGHRPCRETDG